MSPTLIFANPISGRGNALAIARRLARHLSRLGMDPRVITDRAGHADLPPIDRISAAISIGGDGTLRTVAQRLVDDALAAGRSTVPFPLAIVPMGTANLMALHTGNRWPADRLEHDLAAALQRRRSRLIDVACTPRGIFLIMAGVGFDAAIIHDLHRQRTGPITHLSYLRPIASALIHYDFPAIEVTVDGRIILPHTPALCFIGNAREYGTGFPLLTRARTDDGLLDVLVLPAASRTRLWHLAMAMMTGEHIREEGALYVRGRHVEVWSDHPVPVQIDGEVAGHTPLLADILPIRIPFLLP